MICVEPQNIVVPNKPAFYGISIRTIRSVIQRSNKDFPQTSMFYDIMLSVLFIQIENGAEANPGKGFPGLAFNKGISIVQFAYSTMNMKHRIHTPHTCTQDIRHLSFFQFGDRI